MIILAGVSFGPASGVDASQEAIAKWVGHNKKKIGADAQDLLAAMNAAEKKQAQVFKNQKKEVFKIKTAVSQEITAAKQSGIATQAGFEQKIKKQAISLRQSNAQGQKPESSLPLPNDLSGILLPQAMNNGKNLNVLLTDISRVVFYPALLIFCLLLLMVERTRVVQQMGVE